MFAPQAIENMSPTSTLPPGTFEQKSLTIVLGSSRDQFRPPSVERQTLSPLPTARPVFVPGWNAMSLKTIEVGRPVPEAGLKTPPSR